jgi:hypothetical protein
MTAVLGGFWRFLRLQATVVAKAGNQGRQPRVIPSAQGRGSCVRAQHAQLDPFSIQSFGQPQPQGKESETFKPQLDRPTPLPVAFQGRVQGLPELGFGLAQIGGKHGRYR